MRVCKYIYIYNVVRYSLRPLDPPGRQDQLGARRVEGAAEPEATNSRFIIIISSSSIITIILILIIIVLLLVLLLLLSSSAAEPERRA